MKLICWAALGQYPIPASSNRQFTCGVPSEGVLLKHSAETREILQEIRFTSSGKSKSAEILRKACGDFAEIFRSISATTPSRTTPQVNCWSNQAAIASTPIVRRSQRGGGNGGGVTAPKFCGFGLEFSQMFWAGPRGFPFSWALQPQSENPSCPILRTSESLSKPVPNASATRDLARHHSHPGPKQSSVQAMVEDCCGFWMGPLFDFRRPKFWYVLPPPLFGP